MAGLVLSPLPYHKTLVLPYPLLKMAKVQYVKTGDVVFIPQGAAHSYQNTGEEPFEFLCIVPNKEDKITILDEAC